LGEIFTKNLKFSQFLAHPRHPRPHPNILSVGHLTK